MEDPGPLHHVDDAGHILVRLRHLLRNRVASLRAHGHAPTAHLAEQKHTPLGFLGPLGVLFSVTHETSGGDYTILRGQMPGRGAHPFRNVHAAGLRVVYDFADLDRSLMIISTGESGHPFSRRYDDLGELWARGDMIPMFPSYRLKIIPKADGPGAAIKQLVTAAPQDVTIHELFRGQGTVDFGASANSDLRSFAPLAEANAFYQVASYVETYGEVVFDYLTNSGA